MDMDYRYPSNQSRNFPRMGLDHDWRPNNNNIPLQSIFPDASLSRNIYVNFPFPRIGDNFRNPWNFRDNPNRRRPIRRHPSINEMRNSIRRVTQEMYEAYDDFDDARVEFQDARIRVEDSRNEVIQMKTGLQTSIEKLERLLNNFQAPRILNNLNSRDRNTFQRELENVRHDIDEARIRVSEVENETPSFSNQNVQSSINQPSSSSSSNLMSNNNNINNNNNNHDNHNHDAKRMRPAEMSEAEASISNNNNNNDKNDKNDDSNSCSVCMENPVNAVLYSCGHMCMCFSCSRKLLRRRGDNRKCPMCRAVIRDVIKIYKC